MEADGNEKGIQKCLESKQEVVDLRDNKENNLSKAGDSCSRKVFISTMVMTGDRNHNFSEEDVPASETFVKLQGGKACWEFTTKQDIPKQQPISSQMQQVQCGISSVEDNSASQGTIEHDKMRIIVKEKSEEIGNATNSGSIGLDSPGAMATSQLNRNDGVKGALEDGNSKSKERNEDFLCSEKCLEKPLILKEDHNTSLVSVVDRIKKALQRVSEMYEESKLKNSKGNVPDLKSVEKPILSPLATTPRLSGTQAMPDKPQPIMDEGNNEANESPDSTVRRDCGDGEIESSVDIRMASTEAKANKQTAIERNVNDDSKTFEVHESNPQVLDSNLSVHSEKTDHMDDTMLDENAKEAGCNIMQPQVLDSQHVNNSYSTPTDITLNGSGREERSTEELFEGIYDNIFEKVKLDSDIVREQEAMEIASSLFLQNTEQDRQDDTMSRKSYIDWNVEDGIEGNEDIGECENIDFAISTVNATEINEEEATHEEPSKQTAAQRLIEKFKLNIDNSLSETNSVVKCQKGMKNLPAERVPIIGQHSSTRKVSKSSSNLERLLEDKQGKLKLDGLEKVDVDTRSHQETKGRVGNTGDSARGDSGNYLRLPPQLMKKGGKSSRINKHRVKEAVKRCREQFKSRKHQISNAEASDSISSTRKGKTESVQSFPAVKEPWNKKSSVKTSIGVGNSSDVKICALEAKNVGTDVAMHKTSNKEHQSVSKTGAPAIQVKCFSAVKKPMIVDRLGLRTRDVENSSNVKNSAFQTESAKAEGAKHKTSHRMHQSLSKTSTVARQVESLSVAKEPRTTTFSTIRITDVGDSTNGKSGVLETKSGGTEITRHKTFQKEHQSLSKTRTVPRQVECLSAAGKTSIMNTSSVQVKNKGISTSEKNSVLGTRSAGTDHANCKASHKGHQGLTKTSTVWKQATAYKVCVKIICTEKASYVKQTKKGPVNVCDKSIQITTVKNRVSPKDHRKYASVLKANFVPVKSGRLNKQKENENRSPLTLLRQPVRVQKEAKTYNDKREGEHTVKTKAINIASSDDDDEIEIVDNPAIRNCKTSSSSFKTKSVSSMTNCNKAVVTSSKTVLTDNTAATVTKQLLSSSVVNTSSCSVSTGSSTASRGSSHSSSSVPVHADRNKVLANRVAHAVSSSVQGDKTSVPLLQGTSSANSKIAANSINSTDLQNRSNAFPKIVGVCSLAKPNRKTDNTVTLRRQNGVDNVSKQSSLKIDIAENPVAKSILETLLKGKSMLCKSSQFSAVSSSSHSHLDMSVKRAESSQSTRCIDSLNSPIASVTGKYYAHGPITAQHKPYAVNSTTLPGNIFSSLASRYSQKRTALSSSSTSSMPLQQAESMSVPQMNMPLLQQIPLPHSARITELAQQHRNFHDTGTFCIQQSDNVSKQQETCVPKQLLPTASLPKPGYQPAHQTVNRSMPQGVLVRIMKDSKGKYVLVPVPNNSSLLSPVVLQANSTNPDVAISTAHYLAYQHVRNPIPQSWKDGNVSLSAAQDDTSQHVGESILQNLNDPNVAVNTAQDHIFERVRDSIPQKDKNLNIVLTTAQTGITQPVTTSIPQSQNRPHVALTTAQDQTVKPVPSSISQSDSKLNIALTTAQSHTSQAATNPTAQSQTNPDVALNVAEARTSQPMTDSIRQSQNNANVALTTTLKDTSQSTKNPIPQCRNSPHVATTTTQDHTLQPLSSSIPQNHCKPTIALTTAYDHAIQFVTSSISQSQKNANVAVTTVQDHTLQPASNSVPQSQNKSTVALTTAKDHASPLVAGLIPQNQSNPDVATTIAQSHAPHPLPNSTPKSQITPNIALTNKQNHSLQPLPSSILKSQTNADVALITAQDRILQPVPHSIPQTQKDHIVAQTTPQDHISQSVTDSIPKSSNNLSVALTKDQEHASRAVEDLIPQSQNNPDLALAIAQSHASQPFPNSTLQSFNNPYIPLTTAQDPTLQPVPSHIPESQNNPKLALKILPDHTYQPVTNSLEQHQSNPGVALATEQSQNCQILPNLIPQRQKDSNVALATAKDHTLQPVPYSIPDSQGNVDVVLTTAEDYTLKPIPSSIAQNQIKPSGALTTAQSHTSQPLPNSIPQGQNNVLVAVTTADYTLQPLPNSIPQSQSIQGVAVTTAHSHTLKPVEISIPQGQRESNVTLTTSEGHTSKPITNQTPKAWGIPNPSLTTTQNCNSEQVPNPISKSKIVVKSTIPTLTYNRPFASQAPQWEMRISGSLQNKAQLPIQTVETSASAATEKPMLTGAQVPTSVSNMPQVVAVKSVSGTKWATFSGHASLKVNSEDVQSKPVTNDFSHRAVTLRATNCQTGEQAANNLPMKLDSKVANSASLAVSVSSNKTLQTKLESTIRAYKKSLGNVKTGGRVTGNIAALSTNEQHLLGSHENASPMESNSQAVSAEKAINLKGDYDTSPFWLVQASKKKVNDDLRYKLQSSVFRSMCTNFPTDMKEVGRQPKDCDPSVMKQIMEKHPHRLNSKKFEIKLGVFENQFALINPNRPYHSFSPDCSDQQFIQNVGLESVVEAVKAFEGAEEVADDSERHQWMFVQCKEALERRMGKSIKRKLKEAIMRTSAIIERKVAKLEDSMKKVNSVSGEKQVFCGGEVEIDRSTDIAKNEKQKNNDSKLIEKEKIESRDSAGVVPGIDIEHYINDKDKISTGEISARAKSMHKITQPEPLTNPFKRKFDSLKDDEETMFGRKGSSDMNRKGLHREHAELIKVKKEAGGAVKKMKSVNGFKVRELFVGVEDILL